MKTLLILLTLTTFHLKTQLALRAATIVAPSANTSTEANAANSLPFSLATSSTPSMRYQQVFSSSEFSSLAAGGEYITQLTFRPDETNGTAFSTVLTDIQINFSTTTATPTTISNTFSNNVGLNDTVVVPRGPLTLSSSNTGPGIGPKDFDIVINLSAPFFYNPASGNLLLDVRNFNGMQATTFFDAENNSGITTGRVHASNVNAVSGVTDFTPLGLVTRFTTTPVPEPTTGALLAVSLIALSVNRIRKRA